MVHEPAHRGVPVRMIQRSARDHDHRTAEGGVGGTPACADPHDLALGTAAGRVSRAVAGHAMLDRRLLVDEQGGCSVSNLLETGGPLASGSEAFSKATDVYTGARHGGQSGGGTGALNFVSGFERLGGGVLELIDAGVKDDASLAGQGLIDVSGGA